MPFLFTTKVAFQDFPDIFTDIELAEVLQVRQAFEKQDARDQAIGVLHLVDRLVVFVLFEPLEPPVSEHARVQEILVDRGQLIFQTERSEEHTSELQSLMRISYAVFCLKKIKKK